MFSRILVPTDGSPLADKAIKTAVDLAKVLGAEVHAVNVIDPYVFSYGSEIALPPPAEFFKIQRQNAASAVREVHEACVTAGVRCRTAILDGQHPWRELIGYATDQGCDLIVMASNGRRGLMALLLGSETQKVLTHSTIPVLVVR